MNKTMIYGGEIKGATINVGDDTIFNGVKFKFCKFIVPNGLVRCTFLGCNVQNSEGFEDLFKDRIFLTVET